MVGIRMVQGMGAPRAPQELNTKADSRCTRSGSKKRVYGVDIAKAISKFIPASPFRFIHMS